jgi:hypothetical protein
VRELGDLVESAQLDRLSGLTSGALLRASQRRPAFLLLGMGAFLLASG